MFLFIGGLLFFAFICWAIAEGIQESMSDEERLRADKMYYDKQVVKRSGAAYIEAKRNRDIIERQLSILEKEKRIKSISFRDFLNTCEKNLKERFLISYKVSYEFEHLYLIGEPDKTINIHNRIMPRFKSKESIDRITIEYKLDLKERFSVCKSSQDEISYWNSEFDIMINKIINIIENIDNFSTDDLIREGFPKGVLLEIKDIKMRKY